MPFALALALACAPTGPPPSAPEAPPPRDAPYWVERSDLALDTALRATCEAAVADEAPVLLTFTAPWCLDCKQLRAMAAEEPARSEKARYHEVVIDVGRFERHEALRHHFQVASIAYLVALRPTDCTTPVTAWPLLAKGAFEPSGGRGARTPEQLAAWLAEARTR